LRYNLRIVIFSQQPSITFRPLAMAGGHSVSYNCPVYTIYSTEGIILRASNSGEDDRSYLIFTKDFGLLKAEGRSVRKLQSKLRYSLQTYSFVDVSLVRGRGKWKIASCVLKRNFFSDMNGQVGAKIILARICALVLRLVQGEERNEALFNNLLSGIFFLVDKKPEGNFLRNVEYLLALRVLHSLGYLGEEPIWKAFTETSLFETDLLMKIDLAKREVLSTINSSLRETHL